MKSPTSEILITRLLIGWNVLPLPVVPILLSVTCYNILNLCSSYHSAHRGPHLPALYKYFVSLNLCIDLSDLFRTIQMLIWHHRLSRHLDHFYIILIICVLSVHELGCSWGCSHHWRYAMYCTGKKISLLWLHSIKRI